MTLRNAVLISIVIYVVTLVGTYLYIHWRIFA